MLFISSKKNEIIFKYKHINNAMFCAIEYKRYFDTWYSIGLSILNNMIENSKLFMLSQNYNEELNHLQNSFGFTQRIKNDFELEMISTVDFDSKQKSSELNHDYVIHFKGYKTKNVLLDIMRIGGASLSFILYSNPVVPTEWFNTIIQLNSIVKKWFWRKASNETIITLLNLVEAVHLTSDDDLISIIPRNKIDTYLEVVEETAKLNNILLLVSRDESLS